MPKKNPFLPTFGTSPPFLAGRAREVARLDRAFVEGPGNPDYTLLITGPRGSGKTVMLNEAEDSVLARGWSVISVSASVTDLHPENHCRRSGAPPRARGWQVGAEDIVGAGLRRRALLG